MYKSIEIEDYAPSDRLDGAPSLNPHGFLYRVWEYFTLYKELFQRRRLRNALISSSTVALAQQLCGSTFVRPASFPLPLWLIRDMHTY